VIWAGLLTAALLMHACICAEVKPEGKLLLYLTELTDEERQDVFSKLAAAGFATPGGEEAVGMLTNDMLERLGIEPQPVRTKLLKAFATAGR
jgi:hypothetical protein